MTTEGSTDDDRQPGQGSHQGPGGWARRGAAGMGISPGESSSADTEPFADPGASASTADDGDPDISPSLAGGHAGARRHDQH